MMPAAEELFDHPDDGHGAHVLGGILVKPDKLAELRDVLSVDDFAHPAQAEIYRAIVALDADGEPIDACTIMDRIRGAGVADRLNSVGGSDYLTELMERTVTTENLGYHAQRLHEKATRRKLLADLHRVVEHAGDATTGELLDRVERVADATRTRAPTPDIAAELLTAPIADFLGEEDEADALDEWQVENLLPVGVVAFLAGLPKSMKTWVAILIGVCVALGRKLFDRFDCKQGPVVIVTEEDTVKQIRRRLWWLARGLGVDPRTLPMRVSAMKGFRIDDDEHFARLEAEAKGASLIILDALTRVHGVDENSRTEMQIVTHALQALAARTGATVLVIHHMRKRNSQGGDQERAGQRMRGTGDLHALARAIIAAEKRDDGATTLSSESNYSEDTEPFAVKLHIEPPPDVQQPGVKRRAWFEFMGAAKDADSEVDDNKLISVLTGATEPMSVRDIRAAFGGRGSDADKAIKRLASRNAITLVDAEKTDSIGRKQKFKGWMLIQGGIQ